MSNVPGRLSPVVGQIGDNRQPFLASHLAPGLLKSGMSWEKAKLEAERWLTELKVPAKAKGQYFDLADKGATLKAEGGFRLMVLRAADRLIKKRGGTVNLPE